MKCAHCTEKAEIILKKFRNHTKVPYCRLHWLQLCLQETVKHCKINNCSLEKIGKYIDQNISIQDVYSHMTKH